MKTLIIDNYDSFTYNLFHYIGELGGNPSVVKNNAITLQEIEKINPTHLIISPGPGTAEKKEDFGICREIILKFGQYKPLLGVCLGHQGIAQAFGGKIEKAPQVMHGKQSSIEHSGQGLFRNVENPFTAMRYHSLVVSRQNLPEELIITARVQETVMGLQHKQFPIFGVQFHPESFGTQAGKKILQNFLEQT